MSVLKNIVIIINIYTLLIRIIYGWISFPSFGLTDWSVKTLNIGVF
jgi:hypothetical protein